MRPPRLPVVLLSAVLLVGLVGCTGEGSSAPSPDDESGASSPSAAGSSDEADDEAGEPEPGESDASATGPTPIQFRPVVATGNSEPGDLPAGDLRDEFEALDCAQAPETVEVPAEEGQVSCDRQELRYLLDPASLVTEVDAAEFNVDESGNPVLTVTLEPEAAQELERVTTDLADTDTRLAFVVDGSVVTAPRVVAPIEGGVLQVAGAFSEAEAQSLVDQLTGAP